MRAAGRAQAYPAHGLAQTPLRRPALGRWQRVQQGRLPGQFQVQVQVQVQVQQARWLAQLARALPRPRPPLA